MIVGALDISYTCTGWALLEGERGGSWRQLKKFGAIEKPGELVGYAGLSYPWDYREAAKDMAEKIVLGDMASAWSSTGLDAVVIEETNPAGSGNGSRYTNKILEWLHMKVLDCAKINLPRAQIFYVSNSEWRRTLGLKMDKADKRNNELIRRARKVQRSEGGKLDEICARLGATETVIVDRKMLSVRHVNKTFGLDFVKARNNEAEAVCVGEAYLLGAATCDGVSRPRKGQ